MTERRDPDGGTVRPLAALGFATVTFVALLIFGLGMVSLALSEDVIAAAGLGQVPGILATVLVDDRLRGRPLGGGAAAPPRRQVSAGRAPGSAVVLGSSLDHGGNLPRVRRRCVPRRGDDGADLAVAAAAAGRIATTWFGVVVAGAALVSAWGGIALVRPRARRPRWPWEDEFDE